MATAASEQIGVPRRFAIGTLLVLSTMYALLFRALAALGFNTTIVGVIAIFCTIVGVAQVLLFRGQRPREASFAAGFLAAPAMMLLCFLAARFGVESVNPRRALGVHDWFDLLAVMGILATFGIAMGYLAGCSAAGVFFVMDRWQKNAGIVQPTYDDHALGWDERLYDRCIGLLKWLLKTNRNPLKAALMTLLLLAVFVLPSVSFFRPSRMGLPPSLVVYAGYAIAIGAIAVFVPMLIGGILRYRFKPAMIAITLGVVLSLVLSAILAGCVYIVNLPLRRSTEIFYGVIAGGLIGAIVASAIGWLHWIRFRDSVSQPRRRAQIFCLSTIVVLFLVLFVIGYRFANTPRQLALKKIVSNGGGVWTSTSFGPVVDISMPTAVPGSRQDVQHLRMFPDLRSFSCFGGDMEAGAIAELSNCPNLQYVNILDSNFDSDELRSLPTKVQHVLLPGTSMNDDGLRHLARLSVLQNLNVDRTNISDEGIPHLRMCKALRYLCLNECKITGATLSQLTPLPLIHLELASTEVDDKGLEEVAKLKGLRILQLSDTNITDVGIEHLANAPWLQTLQISNTDVTDDAIDNLASITSLTRLAVEGTAITKVGIDRFKRLRPNVQLDYDQQLDDIVQEEIEHEP